MKDELKEYIDTQNWKMAQRMKGAEIRYGYIYQLEFIASKHVYVGATRDRPNARLKKHLAELYHNIHQNLGLLACYQEYGSPRMRILRVLVNPSMEDMAQAEDYQIEISRMFLGEQLVMNSHAAARYASHVYRT